jgi:HTH-type transcriptional regulator, quorum sensing regulator NprR
MNDYSCTLLKLERIKQNKGQKEVCYGICVPSYLSKIERNHVMPDPSILRQLFLRLGIEFYCEDDFVSANQGRIKKYLEQLEYGLNRSAFAELQSVEQKLTYSPLAIDWLLVQFIESNMTEIQKPSRELSECIDIMTDKQLAYYNMFLPMEKGKEDKIITLYLQAFNTLYNSYSLSNLMLGYWLNGQYDKVHEYSEKCIALALEEGNTHNLAQCYGLIGDVYACLNVEDLMMPYYKRTIHLLQNTYWNNQLGGIYYNIGATYLSNKKYDLALEYFEMVDWTDSFLLDHKKALTRIRSGNTLGAEKYIEQMMSWVQKQEQSDAVQVEKLMLEETIFECEDDFLENPKFIILLEKLMDCLKKNRHKGYILFYQDILKEAYCKQRQYKKALELYN